MSLASYRTAPPRVNVSVAVAAPTVPQPALILPQCGPLSRRCPGILLTDHPTSEAEPRRPLRKGDRHLATTVFRGAFTCQFGASPLLYWLPAARLRFLDRTAAFFLINTFLIWRVPRRRCCCYCITQRGPMSRQRPKRPFLSMFAVAPAKCC